MHPMQSRPPVVGRRMLWAAKNAGPFPCLTRCVQFFCSLNLAGNIFVMPGGEISLIDCGQVKQITGAFRVKLAKVVILVAEYLRAAGVVGTGDRGSAPRRRRTWPWTPGGTRRSWGRASPFCRRSRRASAAPPPRAPRPRARARPTRTAGTAASAGDPRSRCPSLVPCPPSRGGRASIAACLRARSLADRSIRGQDK